MAGASPCLRMTSPSAAKSGGPPAAVSRPKRVALTPRGTSAISVIREAVGELETAWAQQLGPKRFAQLRGLLLELNQSA